VPRALRYGMTGGGARGGERAKSGAPAITLNHINHSSFLCVCPEKKLYRRFKQPICHINYAFLHYAKMHYAFLHNRKFVVYLPKKRDEDKPV
jgi:hypothetical protein